MRPGTLPSAAVGCWLGGARAGQTIVWVAVMLPFFLSVVGLAIDGGIVFSARRDLQDMADGAARLGAMQIDQQLYRESAGATIALDGVAARHAVAEYVARQGAGVAVTIAVEPQRVVVQASREVPTSFVRLVGINRVRISAIAPAEPRPGIERGER